MSKKRQNINNTNKETACNFKSEETKDTDSNDSKHIKEDVNKPVYYPYAEWMLSEIKDQYTIENERENKISTKASAFITVIVAIITLYIPMIPLENLLPFFVKACGFKLYFAITLLVFLSAGLICLVVAFYLLIKAYGVKGYKRVQVDDLLKIANSIENENENRKSQIAQSIAGHYHKILRGTVDDDGNMKINSNSAKFVRRGILWTIIGFIIMSIATIALRIIVI